MTTARATWRRNPSSDPGGLTMVDHTLVKRRDGKLQERFSDAWIAEYSEHPSTGLWEVEIFRQDVCEWHALDFESLEEARLAAQGFYDQV